MLKFYNSLSKKIEEFKPLDTKKIGIYTCGPTVYDYAHIGNLRAYIFADVLTRTIKLNDFETKWVMNITDVDDKTINRSKEKFFNLKPKEALKKFTLLYEDLFWQDVKKLNISTPTHTPRATETIVEMQDLIRVIFNTGYAYEKDGSVYFNIRKYSEKYSYGLLAELDLSQIQPGTRVDADQYEKENINDFVLWKAAKEGEPVWDFEIDGKKIPGRPGWHIECSAMSQKYLGTPFDIHTGGVDLKFPHHEDELAQSAIGYNHKKPVNYWLHNEHLMVENKKMSKSLGNFYTLRDIEEKNFEPLAFRFLCLQSHYRSKMNFTWESLEAAKNGLNNLRGKIENLPDNSEEIIAEKEKNKIKEIINNDLDTPRLMAYLFEVKNLNVIIEVDKILGLNLFTWLKNKKEEKIPEEIIELSQERDIARKNKDFAKADNLRKKIEEAGYILEDTPEGPRIVKN